MANRSLLALALLIVLLAGSLEARPRTIVLNILVPEDSPSPSNDSLNGSSRLFESLREQGFKVALAPQSRDLLRLSFDGEKIVLFVIGSSYFSEEASQGLMEALRYLASRESGAGGIAVIVADEAPNDYMLNFIEEASRLICGDQFFAIAPGIASIASSRLVIAGANGDVVVAEAGSSGLITGLTPQSQAFLAISAVELLRNGAPAHGEVNGIPVTVFALAVPSPIDGSPVPVPAGAMCSRESRSLVLLADSSVLLNGSPASPEIGRILVSLTFPGSRPEQVVVLTVQEAYIGGGGRDIALSVHPSIVVLSLAQALPDLERGLAASIRSVPILALGFLASTTLLLAALSSGGREMLLVGGLEGEVNRGRMLRRLYMGARMGWLRAGFWVRKRLQRLKP